jgi:predicted CoA-binding protein
MTQCTVPTANAQVPEPTAHWQPDEAVATNRFPRFIERMKTVAVLGASANRNKYGNKAVRAFLQQGYTVYPVNPKETEIEGLPVCRTIRDVPVRPHKVSVYLPPSVLLGVLPEIAAKGCDELWLNPGTESDAALAEAERLGINVIQVCSIMAVGISPEEMPE